MNNPTQTQTQAPERIELPNGYRLVRRGHTYDLLAPDGFGKPTQIVIANVDFGAADTGWLTGFANAMQPTPSESDEAVADRCEEEIWQVYQNGYQPTARAVVKAQIAAILARHRQTAPAAADAEALREALGALISASKQVAHAHNPDNAKYIPRVRAERDSTLYNLASKTEESEQALAPRAAQQKQES